MLPQVAQGTVNKLEHQKITPCPFFPWLRHHLQLKGGGQKDFESGSERLQKKKKLCMHELIASLTACMHMTSTRSSQSKYQHRKKETYEVPTIAKELFEIHGCWEEG